MDTTQLSDRLQKAFSECPGAVIAFSGGVDSSLVAAAARRFLGRDRCLAVISDSASLKRSELAGARSVALELDIPLLEVQSKEMENPLYRANPRNRCYHCKTALYTELNKLPQVHTMGWWMGNGTNTDDLGDFRPGLQAASEALVHSPLLDAGLCKEQVRALAQAWEIPVWNKPASPCLSSRIPYGLPVTREKLQRIETAEELLQSKGFPLCRVRHFENKALLEVPQERVADLRKFLPELSPALAAAGFDNVVIDEEGFVSGKMNRALS